MKNKTLINQLKLIVALLLPTALVYLYYNNLIDTRTVKKLSIVFAISYTLIQFIDKHWYHSIIHFIFYKKINRPSSLFLFRIIASSIIVTPILIWAPVFAKQNIENALYIVINILLNTLLITIWSKNITNKIKQKIKKQKDTERTNDNITSNQTKINEVNPLDITIVQLTTKQEDEVFKKYKDFILPESFNDLKQLIKGDKPKNKINWIKCGKSKEPSYLEVFNLIFEIRNSVVSTSNIHQIPSKYVSQYVNENFSFLKNGQIKELKLDNISKTYSKYRNQTIARKR